MPHPAPPGPSPQWAPPGAPQPQRWEQPGQGPTPNQPEGRDPYRPFNEPDLPRVNAEQFAPSPNRNLTGVVIAAIALVGIVVFAVTQGANLTQPSATPAKTRTANPSLSPGAGHAEGLSIEFPNGSGRWSVKSSRWEGSTLRVTFTISVDEGVLDYTLFAFENSTAQIIEPDHDSSGDAPYPRSISAGKSETRTLIFHVAPKPITLVLANESGRKSISALRINP